MSKFVLRKITQPDNISVSEIIKSVMTKFKADPCSTVLGEESINNMFENYQILGSAYYVVEENNLIVGGSGIKQLDGTNEKICELQRMFLLPSARGKGFGKQLILKCINFAHEFGYRQIYLESLSQMHDAIKLYEKNGFERIDFPKGNTGHGGCNVYMILNL